MGRSNRGTIRRNSIKGIGLIELSFFITAFGLMVAVAAPFYRVYENHKRMDVTNATLTQVKTALNAYYQQYGYLPCPASRNAPFGSSAFGTPSSTACSTATDSSSTAPVELGDGTARADGRQIPLTTGPYWPIRIGALPVRTLGLPDSAAVDKWGNLLTYAVTEKYATPSAPGDMLHGAIAINDSNGNSVTASPGIAVFAVIAAGADSRGAWNPETGSQLAGTDSCPGVSTQTQTSYNPAGNRPRSEVSSSLPTVAYNCSDYTYGQFRATTLTSNNGAQSFTNMVAYSAGTQACSALTTGGNGIGNVAILVATNGTMATPDISTVPGQTCTAAPVNPTITGSVATTPPGSPSIPAPCAGLTGVAAMTCAIAQATTTPAPTTTTTSGICHKLETVNGTCCFDVPVVCEGTTAGDAIGSTQAENNVPFSSSSGGTNNIIVTGGTNTAVPVSGPLGECAACGPGAPPGG